MSSADVLILTALQDELDAVLALGEGGRGGWSEHADQVELPYYCRDFARTEGGPPLAVAAARLLDMGELETAMRGAELLRELEPACVAMCGICAGLRGEVALGDVIVADRLYSYDHGKLMSQPLVGRASSRARLPKSHTIAAWSPPPGELRR